MRVELTRPIGHYPLKVARLPIPPPGQVLNRATDGTRTRDLDLGKVALYQLSYCRIKKQPQILIAGTKVVLFFEPAKFLELFLMFLSIIFELTEGEKLLLQFN